ncbi:MAG: hypothetical protein Q9220_001949, partial [cf. Caloplaca sp. 1 TL-2023]
MAYFLCPRALSSASYLSQAFPTPTLRCLHHASRQTRPQRLSQASSRTTSRRAFTSSPCQRKNKTVEQARSQNRTGPFSPRSAVLFLTAGAGMWLYFRYEKDRMERKKIAESAKGVGRPKVGGAFQLIDQDGRSWTEQNIKGGYTLVYFGFTHCPDICPEELDKMSRMINLINGSPTSSTAPIPPPPPPAASPSSPDTSTSPTASPSPSPPIPTTTTRPPILPLFITCDPARDTPSVLSTYLREFHPSLIGLTGTWQQVKDICRAYRVYFSTPEGVKPGMDYLVDHSIYFYVMEGHMIDVATDPDGDFVECIGRQHTPESGAKIIQEHMSDWKNGT